MTEKKGAAPLSRADIESIVYSLSNHIGELTYLTDEQVRDLATTCLGLMDDLAEMEKHGLEVADEANRLERRATAAEARVKELEEGLEDALHELTALDGLVATDTPNAYADALSDGCDASGAWDVFACNLHTVRVGTSIDRLRALLSERSDEPDECRHCGRNKSLGTCWMCRDVTPERSVPKDTAKDANDTDRPKCGYGCESEAEHNNECPVHCVWASENAKGDQHGDSRNR